MPEVLTTLRIPTTVPGTPLAGHIYSNSGVFQFYNGVAWVSTLAGYGITDTYTKAQDDARFQPLDTDLTTIAGLTPTTDNFMVGAASAWASRTPAQARTSLGLGTAALNNTGDFEVPLTFQWSLNRTGNTINLTNDLVSPGTLKYYGTDGSGARGFYALPVAGGGDVTGPAGGVVDSQVAVYNGTTGKIIKAGTTVAGIATISGTGVLATTPDNHSNWDTAFSERAQWNGGSTNLVAATGRTSLGANTVGSNIFTLANPGAVSYPRIDALNAVTAASAATIKTDLSLNNVTNDAQIKASDFPASVSSGQICLFNGAGGKSIQAGTGTGLVTVASGVYSVIASTSYEVPLTFSNTVRRTTNTIDLVGDASAPGNSQYYGTNPSGTKGWYALTPPKVTAIAASGTFTCTTGVRSIKVECVGGGGGGGGAKAAAGNCATGGGGGGGGYSVALLTSGLKASYTVVVGAGGTAGAATPTDGGTGGSTSFDSPSVCTATGGGPGFNSAAGSTVPTFQGNAGVGGTGSVGNYGFTGSQGEPGTVQGAAVGKGGSGGSSQWGGSCTGGLVAAAGVAGRTYGGGGSGACSNSATGFAGGAGGAGAIIVTEYF